MSFKTIGATLLIASTAIGGGILAMPEQTQGYGLMASILLLSITWLATYLSGRFLLHALLTSHASDIITLSKHYLGTTGALVAKISAWLLLIALIAAYLQALKILINIDLIIASGVIILLILPTKYLDYCNRLVTLILLISYILVLIAVQPSNTLAPTNYLLSWQALPIMLLAFGFAIILPSLTTYLNYNRRELNKALLYGSLLVLGIYIYWEIIFLQGNSAPLKSSNLLVKIFACSTIITSLFGTSLASYNLIKPLIANKLLAATTTLAIPLLLNMLYPQGFNQILNFAAIFVAILLGIIPSYISYKIKHQPKLAITSLLFFLLIIGIEFNKLCSHGYI